MLNDNTPRRARIPNGILNVDIKSLENLQKVMKLLHIYRKITILLYERERNYCAIVSK